MGDLILELLTKIKRLSKLPFNEAIKKIINKSYDIPYLTVRKLIIKYKPIRITAEEIDNYKPSYQFFFSNNEKLFLLEKLRNLRVEKQIIEEADKICSHHFNLLGSGDVYLGKEILWNKDFKSGFVWENAFYKDIKIIDLNNNADVKVPWELSRFQHLFTLGKAYWITDNNKYVQEFVSEIEDWIKKNPVEMSVNWTCTMDVGIRAVNWIASYAFFRDSKIINKEFWKMFHRSLYLHGKFIMNNLENRDKHTGNHYLSNLVGLVWIGIYFQDLKGHYLKKQSVNWLKFALKELEKEMFIQNNLDGTNYEASTSYHRLVTELFLITTILCGKNKINFSKSYMERLEKMCTFIENITKPNGLSPIIGDADDGRLLILSNYGNWVKNDFRHFLGIAGQLFNRNDFRYFGQAYNEDTLWIYKKLPANIQQPKPLQSSSYPDGGYYILRNERVYCCIRCGELSFRGQGTHSHNDQLSFELNVDGEDFIIDPGSYVYTADYKARNAFRSTKMHNTVQIEGYEQNDFEEKNLFYMKEQTFALCEQFDICHFTGVHSGFESENEVRHRRKMKLSNNDLIIKDYIFRAANVNKFFYLHLAPNVKVVAQNNKYILLEKNKTYIKASFSETEFLCEPTLISDSYGLIVKSISLKVKFTKNDLYVKFEFMDGEKCEIEQ